jgi:hypothetical protein
MPAFTAESGMIAGGGPDGTIARRRTPWLLPAPPDDAGADDADADAPGAAFEVPASNSNPSAVRTEKPARRTKP